jgi:hypothetical protein
MDNHQNRQAFAREQLVQFSQRQLAQHGIRVPPGGNVLSIYQQMLMREGIHPFQVYARNELTRRGIDVPPGKNVLSLFQRIRMMENN